MSNNQQNHWNNKHKAGHISKFSEEPNPLAVEVSRFIQIGAKILELGCGAGIDSKYFAEQGFDVVSTDFASVVIAENQERYKNIPNLKFEVLDTKVLNSFKYEDFDLIYARLSLHYFTDIETKLIFKTIKNKLVAGGRLAFLCKSTKDPFYGQGELIEKDMYTLDGHVRHFFSEEYVKECLTNDFKILTLESGDEFFNGKKSSFVKIICEKK